MCPETSASSSTSAISCTTRLVLAARQPSGRRTSRSGTAFERADGSDDCANYGAQCDVLPTNPNATNTTTFATTGLGSSPHPPVLVNSWGNAISIEVRVRNTINLTGGNCNELRQLGLPMVLYGQQHRPEQHSAGYRREQRSRIADPALVHGKRRPDRPLRWLRLDIDPTCNTDITDRLFGWKDAPPPTDDAASRPVGSTPCYVVNMGLQGGMARDQDEPPIALLLGSGPSQRALVDCDPDTSHGQVEDEIRDGCAWPPYRGNNFDDPPGPSGWCPYGDDTPGTFFDLPKPSPFDDWEPFDCVLTRTGNALQMMKGFNQRLFGVNNNPESARPTTTRRSSPAATTGTARTTRTRRYGFAWDGTPANALYAARGTKFNDADKRLVSLFLTPYGSFTGSGNEVQELVGLGSFYITGYGNITGSGLHIEDPCSDGAGFPGYPYTANEPPPDSGHVPEHRRDLGTLPQGRSRRCDRRDRRSLSAAAELQPVRARPGRIASGGWAVWGG